MDQFQWGMRREGVVTRSAHKKSELQLKCRQMERSGMMSRKRKAEQHRRRQEEEVDADLRKDNPMETTAKTHPIFSD